MLNLINYIFLAGRILRLTKDAANMTSSANPLVLIKNVTLVAIDCCLPLQIKLTIHCIAAASLLEASVVSPNPVTVGSAIHIISEIYENC